MTWSLTLAGLPHAGAKLKPHDCKQYVQKMKDLPKKWVLRGKQFEDFGRKKKNRNVILDLSKTTQWNTRALIASIEEGPRKK